MEINKIYNSSAEELMEKMIEKNQKVSTILTSPPYNNTRRRSKRSLIQELRDTYESRYDVYLEKKTDDEYIEWMVQLFNQFNQILEKNGTVILNITYANDSKIKKKINGKRFSEPNTLVWKVIYNILERTNFTVVDKLVWKKSNALPNNRSPNKLTRLTEDIFIFSKKEDYATFLTNKEVKSVLPSGQKSYSNIYNFIEAKNNDGVNKLNKATYSTDLVKQLLDIYGVFRKDTDNVIYDPFMGTGTTANACLWKGFNYLGSEISKDQITHANNRLKETKKLISKQN